MRGKLARPRKVRAPAEYNSAIQQIANLRYAKATTPSSRISFLTLDGEISYGILSPGMTGLIQPSLRSFGAGGSEARAHPPVAPFLHSTCTYLQLLAPTCTYLHKKNYFSVSIFLSTHEPDRGCVVPTSRSGSILCECLTHSGAIRTSSDQSEPSRRFHPVPAVQNRTKPYDLGWGVKNKSLIIKNLREHFPDARSVLFPSEGVAAQ